MPIVKNSPKEIRGAIIGHNNLLTSSNSFSVDGALTPNTWERFAQGAGALALRQRLTSNADINYIAIAAHNLEGETLLISTSDTQSGTHTDVESITFTDNKPVMITFEPRDTKEVMLSGTTTKDIEIGVIYAGIYLQMPQPIYGGHSPVSLSDSVEYQSTQSESGQFLSRNIVRRGSSGSFSWQRLEPDFVRGDFLDFKRSAQTTPFFIKWRPDYHSDEVSYCYTDSEINVSNMGGGHRLMSASMSIKAHDDL